MQGGRTRYSYEDAGFNGFFKRTVASNPNDRRLTTAGGGSSRNLNMDDIQLSGPLGNVLRIGKVLINGVDGRVELRNDDGEIVGYFGERIQ